MQDERKTVVRRVWTTTSDCDSLFGRDLAEGQCHALDAIRTSFAVYDLSHAAISVSRQRGRPSVYLDASKNRS
jgi:hypothetical protein